MALVTGGGKRLGAATVKALHRRGFTVAIHYHHSGSDAAQLSATLNRARPNSSFTLQQDLAEADAGERLIAQLQQHSARLDLVVNSASVFESSPLGSSNVEQWDRVHAINARAPYFLALASAPLLTKRRGSVVNIGDIHAAHPRHDYAVYCISKAALVAATQALAVELAPDVRVNAVAPGAILWAADEDQQLRDSAIAQTPMQRCGDPEDIAGAVVYLAEASYVTGQVLAVDGGRRLTV